MKLNGVTHLQSEKFNIAWFKLAEFVARKEKERALGLYRLLAHSIGNAALEAQLEGDLLLAFNDNRAHDSYLKAAELYEQEGKLTQAIAITEHASMVSSESLDCMLRLSHLYQKAHEQKRASEYAVRIIRLLLEKETVESVIHFCQTEALSRANTLMLLEQLVLELLSRITYPEDAIKDSLNVLMPELIQYEDTKRLTTWLAVLASTHTRAHEYARTFLK